MRSIITIVVLSSLLSACASSPPFATDLFDVVSGRDALFRAIADDCMTVNVMLFKEEGKAANLKVAAHSKFKEEDRAAATAVLAAHYHCQTLVGECRDHPGSEDCKKLICSYDLKRGASGASALYEASYHGNTRLVRQLLESGFDPNAPLGGPGWIGWTPLMIATAENHDGTVRVLLAAGADPNAQNDLGRTSLMFASKYGNAAIATMLLDKGANPNVVPKDETGWTALMAAASKGHSRVVQLLLEHGADKSLHDKTGQTALALAEANNHSESARILREFGKSK